MRRLRFVLLLVRSMMWMVSLPVLKHVLTMPRLAALMWREAREERRDQTLEAEVVVVVSRLYAGGRIPRRHNCFERSLLTYRYLSELNADPVLVVGLAQKEQSARGHAWVVVDDQAVGEEDHALSEMAPILMFGPRGALITASSG